MREKVAQRLTKRASSPKPISRDVATAPGNQAPVAEAELRAAAFSEPFSEPFSERASEPFSEPASEPLGAASDAALLVSGGAEGAVGWRPRALIVDDDPEVRRALARLLRPELEVHLAGSVAEAQAALARLDRVDVAFVDLQLPDGTGEEILEQLSAWPDAIRVLISGSIVSNENPLKNRALANLVLGKPVASHVVEALKRATLLLPRG